MWPVYAGQKVRRSYRSDTLAQKPLRRETVRCRYFGVSWRSIITTYNVLDEISHDYDNLQEFRGRHEAHVNAQSGFGQTA